MADELNAIAEEAAPELETPAIEATEEGEQSQEIETSEEAEQEFDEDGNPIVKEETPPEDDDDELEFEGKTFKAPKGVKEALMRNEDYTRKTQAIAAKGRDLDLAMQITDKEINARAQLTQIDAQLEEWGKVDWSALEQQDFVKAQTAWRQFQQLKDTRSAAERQLMDARNERSQAAQQDFAKRAEEAAKFAVKNIKGWTPRMGDELFEFATKTAGLSREAVRNSLSPEFLQFLHWAHTGHQLQQRASAPKPKPKPPAAPVEPLRTVSARTNPAPVGLSDSLSADEWMRRRNAQVAKRG